MYVDLVILDELGYLPFTQSGGAMQGITSAVEMGGWMLTVNQLSKEQLCQQ